MASSVYIRLLLLTEIKFCGRAGTLTSQLLKGI